ncbi:MAG TPA: hypothetical protein VGM80_17360 [Gaiellaceae bacterium]
MRRWLSLLVCLSALVVASGAAAGRSPLTGIYQAKIKGSAPQLNGTWLINIIANGTYAVAKEPDTNTLLIGGTSAISGKTIVFTDKAGPLACKVTGKYSWSLVGKKLKLTKVKDTCSGRVAVLSSAPYTKVS